jgi:O-antigen/teichoic acid export membrane protein
VFADRLFLPITVVMGFGLVLNGAESIRIPLNMRRLNYRPIFFMDLASKILSMPVTLAWAWLEPSVWSLVGGGLAGGLCRAVLSHAYLPGPPMSLKWKKDHFREIISFGRWIVVASVATFFSQQSDVILLGLLAPGYVLGLYTIAKLLVGAGEGLLDRLSGALALPIFGEVLRKDPTVFRNRYYRFRLPTDLAAGLLSGGLLVAGNFIVSFLYDPRYVQAGLMCQLLALGTLSVPFALVGNAFTATGDTHFNAFASMLKALSLIVCMAVGFFLFGINGAVGGVALHRIFPSALLILLAHQREWICFWEELRVIPAFVAGAIIGKIGVLAAGALGIANIHQLLHA